MDGCRENTIRRYTSCSNNAKPRVCVNEVRYVPQVVACHGTTNIADSISVEIEDLLFENKMAQSQDHKARSIRRPECWEGRL